MSPLFRVRFADGKEGDVLHVSLGEYTETAQGMTGPVEIRVCGYVALVQLDDNTLTTRNLEDTTVVNRPRRPLPMPIAGPGRDQ